MRKIHKAPKPPDSFTVEQCRKATKDKVWFVIGAVIMTTGIVSFIYGLVTVIIPQMLGE